MNSNYDLNQVNVGLTVPEKQAVMFPIGLALEKLTMT